MSKRAYLIHGWGGKPEEGFRPWLKKELESRGYIVESLAMPKSDTPRIENWIPFLLEKIPSPDENTVLVGHSLGAPALFMYLEKLPKNIHVGKVVLIAGSFKQINDLSPQDKIIAKPWLETQLDYKKIDHAAKSIIAFFSDNDPWVPLKENSKIFKKLHAKIIIEHNMGHYNEDAGIKEVPEILKEILSN